MIPEALRAQGVLGGGKEPLKDALVVPIVQGCLAASGHTAIQRCQQHVLATGEALIAFTDLLIDDRDHLEFLGHVPQCGDGAELDDFRLERFAGSFLESAQQPFGGAKMHEHNGARLAVNAAGFNDLPVRPATAGLFLNSCHNDSVYTIALLGASTGELRFYSDGTRGTHFHSCAIFTGITARWSHVYGDGVCTYRIREGASIFSVYLRPPAVDRGQCEKNALFWAKSVILTRRRRRLPQETASN